MHLFKTFGNEFLQTPQPAVVDTTGLELSDGLIEILSAGPGMAADPQITIPACGF